MTIRDDQNRKASQSSRPPAGGKVKRLFDSPYRIDSPEAPADLSYIGNGRGELIDEAVANIIREAPEKGFVVDEDLEASED